MLSEPGRVRIVSTGPTWATAMVLVDGRVLDGVVGVDVSIKVDHMNRAVLTLDGVEVDVVADDTASRPQAADGDALPADVLERIGKGERVAFVTADVQPWFERVLAAGHDWPLTAYRANGAERIDHQTSGGRVRFVSSRSPGGIRGIVSDAVFLVHHEDDRSNLVDEVVASLVAGGELIEIVVA